MKLGAIYNLFDGEELLEESISLIRNQVDYITVIYQDVSNFGLKNDKGALDILHKLYKNKLINEVFLYTPDLHIYATYNELKKRNIGIDKCKENKCDHFILMDTDEFYINEEFNKAKNICEKFNLDASFVKMYTYYKTKQHILDPIEDYYVPFICKIHPNTTLKVESNLPVLTDPTRKTTTCKNYKIFNQNEIMMHHMSYVRNDISKKLINSSARINFNDSIQQIVNHYNSWKDGNNALVAGNPPKFYNLKKVNFFVK